MNPKKDSTPNLSPSTKDLDKPYNNNSPKIEDAMGLWLPTVPSTLEKDSHQEQGHPFLLY